eukprot:1828211-Amphidinium_carterae.1
MLNHVEVTHNLDNRTSLIDNSWNPVSRMNHINLVSYGSSWVHSFGKIILLLSGEAQVDSQATHKLSDQDSDLMQLLCVFQATGHARYTTCCLQRFPPAAASDSIPRGFMLALIWTPSSSSDFTAPHLTHCTEAHKSQIWNFK